MKVFSGLALVGVLISSSLHAANPINGWYFGIVGGGSGMRSTSLYYNNPNGVNSTGDLKYKFRGGIGGAIGYRIEENFRIELEGLYNNGGYDALTEAGTTNIYKSSEKVSGTQRMGGRTNMGIGFINGFFDFFKPGDDNSNWAPYLGLGVGFAYVQNGLMFYQQNQPTIALRQTTQKTSARTAAGQFIIGIEYFADDFTSAAIDYRFITTKNNKASILNDTAGSQSRQKVSAINLTFNFSLE